ncbi:hypothetical protein J2T08_000529 [Neorhizobium galegae]|uniref:hypothetical protein n=1 Tax=Neorhizobium galegae TaxID=399 RepID=UPI0027819BA4|nr:hypothetical protein [Neorhizobium galegae]MDQ0132628.1 hypothetical protein [Neorhizobium galegae]
MSTVHAHRQASVEEIAAEMDRRGVVIEKLEAECNLFKGKYRALLKLISKTRDKLVHVTDHIEDEGDRQYFGSTNDADALRDLYDDMMRWIWDAVDETNRMKSDPYADIRKQRARAETAEAALAAKDAALLEIARKTVGVGATMTETIGDGRPRIKINFDTVEEMRSFVDGLRALRAALSKQEGTE